MQVKIDSVSDVKTTDKGTSSKIVANGVSYYVPEDATPHIGKMVELTSEERTSGAGRRYLVGKIVKVLGGAGPAANGSITWTDYQTAVKLAHSEALGLEPDITNEDGVTLIDRSVARAALVNTAMIAYSNGKIFIPDDDVPF